MCYWMHLIQLYYYFLFESVHFHAGGCFFVKAAVTVALGVMVTTGMFF